MLKRYDIIKDELVEITQDWFDDQLKYSNALAQHYKANSPENFKKFYDCYILNGKVINV